MKTMILMISFLFLGFLSDSEQEQHKANRGRYKQELIAEDGIGKWREVHEYKSPDGRVGYVIYNYRERRGKYEMQVTHRGHEDRAIPIGWVEVDRPIVNTFEIPDVVLDAIIEPEVLINWTDIGGIQ